MLQNRLMLYLANLSMVIETIGKTRIKRVLILMLLAIPALASTTYYISSSTGNDANNGTSTSTPWKTANPTALFGYNWATPHWHQGDSLLFKRGDTISGAFEINASTGIEHPSFVGAYGTGAKPVLAGDLRGKSWIAITGHIGIYKMWVGNSYLYRAYEFINYVPTAMTIVGSISPDRETWLNNTLLAGCAGPALFQDTLYYHTHDNNPPACNVVFALQGGMVSNVSSAFPMMIRDLDFQGTSNGIRLSYDTNVTVRQVKSRNNFGSGFYDFWGKNNLIDSCRADTCGWSSYYQTSSYRTIFRWDTASVVNDSVRHCPIGGEKNGFASEGTTDYSTGVGCLVEYCYAEKVYGGFDAYYNKNDTIRYSRFTQVQQGVYGMGRNVAIYNNIIEVTGPEHGKGTDLSPDGGTLKFQNNLISGAGLSGGSIIVETCVNGGTAIISGNSVSNYDDYSSRYAWVYTISGVTMTGNTYCGSSKASWYKGVWPSFIQYTTLAAFQSATGLENGSVWSSNGISLPVQVTSFTGSVKGNAVTLNWKTATEINSNMFEIERRTTAQWESIGKIPAGGTSNAPREYVYVDNLKNVSKRSIFYRLKSIDNDGSYQYKGNVEVIVNTAIPTMYMLNQNYPNPFNPSTTINYQLQSAGQVSLKVYDMLGREVASLVNGEKEAGYYSAVFDGSKLSSGTYIYRLQTGSFTETRKLVLLK